MPNDQSFFLNSSAADSPGMSTLLTDITVEIDCSQPNQITVHYPDIIEQGHRDITTAYELLLNCSNEVVLHECSSIKWLTAPCMLLSYQKAKDSMCIIVCYLSFQTQSFCLLYNFDTISGPYILCDEGQIVILPGSTCTVSTCFYNRCIRAILLHSTH